MKLPTGTGSEDRSFRVRVFDPSSTKKLKVQCSPECSVQDLLLLIVKEARLPYTMLPYLSLCSYHTKPLANDTQLARSLGYPFFAKVDACSSELALKLDVCLLPPEEGLVRQTLGDRGLAFLVHQAFTLLPSTPRAFDMEDEGSLNRLCRALISGISFLQRLAKEHSSAGDCSEDKQSLLRNTSDVEHVCRAYCHGLHKHLYTCLSFLRTIIGREKPVVDGLMKSAHGADDDLKAFLDEVHFFEARPHPLAWVSRLVRRICGMRWKA